MTTLGSEACQFIMRGGACGEFLSENQDMMEAHHTARSTTGADARLCTAVQEMIAEDPKAAALTDEGETFAKYCDSHFQTSGASYGKFKHHFVKGHPMPEL